MMGRCTFQPEPVIHLPAVIATPRSLEIVGTHALEVDEGRVVVLSDCHYRADEPASSAHRACVELVSRFAETGTLRVIIINGDAADFPKISKHARIGWEKQPSVAEELAIVGCSLTLGGGMTFREFINLERTDKPGLNDEQFRAVLAAAGMWFEAEQPKRRRGGRRRSRPVVQVEPHAAPDFDLAEELR